MKKIYLILLFGLLFMFGSCSKNIVLKDDYDEDSFGIIDLKKDEVKIMQLTDLHLSYGFDALDRKTFKDIKLLAEAEKPDVIVLTGDVFMSVYAKRLLKKFIKFMESLQIPWAYTFGNHEAEYHDVKEIVNILLTSNTKYLHYHPGPVVDNPSFGYSNYKLQLFNGTDPLLNLYLLDTKAMRTDGIKDDDFPYDYLTAEQVSWYKENIIKDTVKSFAFMHIPLMEYLEYEGDEQNEKVWAQGLNTGFFDAIVSSGKKTLGVFVGHDHLNNHEFYHQDILLAYGVSSGYNAYGSNDSKGAKIIIYNNHDESFITYNKFFKEVK